MLLSSYVFCSSSTLVIDLVRITLWLQQEDSAPSVHECLKPLEARSLLIDEGGKGCCFGHRCEGYDLVLDQGASSV